MEREIAQLDVETKNGKGQRRQNYGHRKIREA